VPLVPHQVAKVIAGLSAFEENVSRKAPEQLFAEFHLQEYRLVSAEVILLDATEPLEPVRPCQFVERNVAVDALPQETDSHGRVPDKLRIPAEVELLMGVAEIA